MKEITRIGAVASTPKIGQVIIVRGVKCTVIKVRPFGTIDVQSIETGLCARVSGYSF